MTKTLPQGNRREYYRKQPIIGMCTMGVRLSRWLPVVKNISSFFKFSTYNIVEGYRIQQKCMLFGQNDMVREQWNRRGEKGLIHETYAVGYNLVQWIWNGGEL